MAETQAHAYYTGSERAIAPNCELYTARLAPAPTIRFGSYRIPSIIRGKQKTSLVCYSISSEHID